MDKICQDKQVQKMNTIGLTLRKLRENKGLLIREVAASLSIDPALLSKIERDDRLPTKEQILSFANFFKQDANDILIAYLSDKVFYELKDEALALKAMQVAEKKIKYEIKNKKKK